MDVHPIESQAFYRVWNDDIAVWVVGKDAEGQRVTGRSINFEAANGLVTEPTYSLSRKAAQALMSSLWEAGIRPAQAKDGDGQAKHLEDMRAIAFGKLGIVKP
jgi:hypothetical protein